MVAASTTSPPLDSAGGEVCGVNSGAHPSAISGGRGGSRGVGGGSIGDLSFARSGSPTCGGELPTSPQQEGRQHRHAKVALFPTP
uniref:Uncharacterized protein n=1 Tax=Oryza punctata TaxID=4537 RepID=A0A0E0M0U2_ORYPU